MHSRAKSSAGFGDFLQSVAVPSAAWWLVGALAGAGGAAAQELPGNLVGMYIHQHWPYNYPYAARTWQVEDYRGYCGGPQDAQLQYGDDLAVAGDDAVAAN